MDRDEECDKMMECDDQGDGNVQVQEKKTEMVIRSCLMTSIKEEYSQTEMEITMCVNGVGSAQFFLFSLQRLLFSKKGFSSGTENLHAATSKIKNNQF